MGNVFIQHELNYMYEAALTLCERNFQHDREVMEEYRNTGTSGESIEQLLEPCLEYRKKILKEAEPLINEYADLLPLFVSGHRYNGVPAVLAGYHADKHWWEYEGKQLDKFVINCIHDAIATKGDETRAADMPDGPGLIHFVLGQDLEDNIKLSLIKLYNDRTGLIPRLHKLLSKVADICKNNEGLVHEQRLALMKRIKAFGDDTQSILAGFGVKAFDLRADLNGFKLYIAVNRYDGVTLWHNGEEGFIYIGLLCDEINCLDKELALNDTNAMKAMAEPIRWKILHYIARENLRPKEIADRLGLTPATISHHMDTLFDNKLLKYYVDSDISRKVQYKVIPETLREVADKILRLAEDASHE